MTIGHYPYCTTQSVELCFYETVVDWKSISTRNPALLTSFSVWSGIFDVWRIFENCHLCKFAKKCHKFLPRKLILAAEYLVRHSSRVLLPSMMRLNYIRLPRIKKQKNNANFHIYMLPFEDQKSHSQNAFKFKCYFSTSPKIPSPKIR